MSDFDSIRSDAETDLQEYELEMATVEEQLENDNVWSYPNE